MKGGFARIVKAACPRCGLESRLNWMKNRGQPRTICVGVHPYSRVPVSVSFRCPHCKRSVDLGFDVDAYS